MQWSEFNKRVSTWAIDGNDNDEDAEDDENNDQRRGFCIFGNVGGNVRTRWIYFNSVYFGEFEVIRVEQRYLRWITHKFILIQGTCISILQWRCWPAAIRELATQRGRGRATDNGLRKCDVYIVEVAGGLSWLGPVLNSRQSSRTNLHINWWAYGSTITVKLDYIKGKVGHFVPSALWGNLNSEAGKTEFPANSHKEK